MAPKSKEILEKGSQRALKMMSPIRYVILVLAVIISLHYILTFSNEGYGNATSLSNIADQLGLGDKFDAPPAKPHMTAIPEAYYHPQPVADPMRRKANATFVVLARNGDLEGVVSSMKQMEDRFNKEFRYPWTFLNEQPFSDDFKKRTSEVTSSPVTYGLIPRDDWYQPEWIDEDRAREARDDMVRHNVIYGASVPYRNMCRFNSGFFYKHELLQNYRYYWRVEPNVKYFCDIHYDPFLVMEDEDKVYGFTLSLYEYQATIPTLWNAVKEFLNANPELVPENNAMNFLSDDGGETYNRCHFWSNFEIGDLDFWRGEAYSKFFDFLDEKGGFYYERWGDAPVHSIGAALFAPKDKIHFFSDIGYRHEPFQHCPQGEEHSRGQCWCDPKGNFDYEWYSCLKRYEGLFQ